MESAVTQKEDCFEIEIPFNLFQYLSTENCNIHGLCRICLSETNQELFPLISTADSGLQEMFTGITAIQVSPNDGLPSQICNLCRTNIITCYEFKTQCLKSDCALKSLLKGEFVTKDESNTAPVQAEPKQSYVTDVSIECEDIKQEIQYLEDLSGSDSETPCITQSTEKDIKERSPETDTIIVQNKSLPNRTKEKKKKSHICSICLKKFRSPTAVKSHVNRIHSSARYQFSCAQCKEFFETEHDLSLHKSIHEPGPCWTCVKCHKGFEGRSMFRRHIKRHMECKRYSCDSCGKPFTELYALRRHTRVHTGEKLEKRYACHLCDKRYTNSSLLEAHIARHGNVRPCVCAVCGKDFTSTRLLMSHHRIHLDEKPHPCRYCEKRFRHESTLRTHERTHTGERPYVCATCGKRFIQNSNLTLHMRTHTGDRPYSCETCGRCFSSSSTLKSHLLTHTGEKPYECTECGKRFARKDMRAHMRLHSGERAHACGVCGRRFLTANRLRDHCRVHTGEKPFECAQCSMKFGSKSHLVKHVKTHQAKKKRHIYIPRDQPKYMNEKVEDDNRTENIETDVMSENGGKDVVVETVQDNGDVTGEIIITDQESQADIQTDTLCLDRVNIEPSYPVNLVTVDESGIRIAAVDNSVKLYQVDQSLVQIHSAAGQLTISKYTSKMTANF